MLIKDTMTEQYLRQAPLNLDLVGERTYGRVHGRKKLSDDDDDDVAPISNNIFLNFKMIGPGALAVPRQITL